MDDATTTSGEGPVQYAGPSEQGTRLDAIDEAPAADAADPAPDAVTEPDWESASVVPEPERVSEEEPEDAPEPEPALETETELGTETESEPEGATESQAEPTLDDLIANLADQSAPATESMAPVQGEADATPEPPEPAAPDAVADKIAVAISAEPVLQQLWTHTPFWIIGGAWLVLTAGMTAMLWSVPAVGFRSGVPYMLLILGGAAFAVIDLVTGLIVWRMAQARATDDDRRGLALAIWNRALLWTAGGVALWWIGLFLLDLHHVVGIG
jgi:hypothetical protein